MTGQYLRVTATHTDGDGSGKTADAMAANAVTGMPVDSCMEFLAGGPMGPVTQMGARASDCASEAKRGSYAEYYTFELNRRKQVEINLNSAITATLPAGTCTVEATAFLAQTGDFTLSLQQRECPEDRGMLRNGVARNGVTPALALPVIGHPV